MQYDGCDDGRPVAWCPVTGTMLFDDDGNPSTPKIDVSPHNVWAWDPAAKVAWDFLSVLAPK